MHTAKDLGELSLDRLSQMRAEAWQFHNDWDRHLGSGLMTGLCELIECLDRAIRRRQQPDRPLTDMTERRLAVADRR
jgi:hypothetical protein